MNDIFNSACQKFLDGYWIEAYSLFNEFLTSSPEGDLVDDALLNLGLLSIVLGNPEKAEVYFMRVIKEFSEADIDTSFSDTEVGKSSLKAAFHLVEMALAKGDADTANNIFKEFLLESDQKSGILRNNSIVSYSELAKSKILAE
jgi:TolA-binding protein